MEATESGVRTDGWRALSFGQRSASKWCELFKSVVFVREVASRFADAGSVRSLTIDIDETHVLLVCHQTTIRTCANPVRLLPMVSLN